MDPSADGGLMHLLPFTPGTPVPEALTRLPISTVVVELGEQVYMHALKALFGVNALAG